jgi:hypothetical protein
MRYLIDSQMGWATVPFIVAIGAAYLWVADRLLGRKTTVETHVETPSITRAA